MSRCVEFLRKFFFLFTVMIVFSACEDTMRLRFSIVTPAGFDWADGIDRVVVSAGGFEKEVVCREASCPFSVKFTFSEGDFARVAVQGYDAGGRLVAAGYSPAFHATGQSLDLAVFFSRVDTGAVADTHFEAAPFGCAVVPYRTSLSEELSANAGTLLFGGVRERTQDATPVDEVWFYDPYLLALVPLEPLSLPLSGPAVMDLQDGNYLIYGGRTTGGRLSRNLLFYSTTSLQAPGSHAITLPPGDAPPAMAGAQVVEVGPFDRLYDNASGRYLLDAFLVFGGATEDGTDAPAWWFAIYYDVARGVTSIETRASDVVLPAGARAAAVRSGDTQVRLAIPEARWFVTARVDTTPAGLSFALETREMPDVPQLANWRMLSWGGRILGLSGRDSTQACDARWFEFSPGDFTTRPLEAAGHCESVLVRMGGIVLEIGGVDASGHPHAASYRTVREEEDGSLLLGEPVEVPMQKNRVEPSAFALPTGAVAVFGGHDPLSGEPVEELEIIVPDPGKSGEPK